MCGILLQLNRNEQSLEGEAEFIFNRIHDDLKIRGPDDQGYYSKENIFMAHGRLGILDIENGRQPMLKNSRVIVYNGEIYNYKELKKQYDGVEYRTNCDTEILLSIPNIDNPSDFLGSLRGMYAFALVDYEQQRLLVARDHFGKKPIYIGNLENKLFVSSRVKTILKLLNSSNRVSPTGLGYYADFGFIPAPFSIIDGVEKLLPGEWRVYDLKGNQLKKGFTNILRYPSSLSPSDQTLEFEDFAEQIYQSTKTRMNSDRPVGVLLSDGIDSSIVTHSIKRIMEEENVNYKAFILSSGDAYDESKGAANFAEAIGIDYKIIKMKVNEETYAEATSALDEPFADLSIFPTYAAFKALKEYATVAITGDGGDELFGGYPYQFNNRFFLNILDFVSSYGFLRRIKLLKDVPHAFSKKSYLYRRISNSGLFHSSYYQELRKKIPSYEQRYRMLCKSRGNSVFAGDIEQAQWSNSIEIGLKDRMLTKVDVCSMGAKVEARSPFLDEDLWNRCMVYSATSQVFKNKDCKQFLKNYASPFKVNPKKSGFTINYERFLQKSANNIKHSAANKVFSSTHSNSLVYKILMDWMKVYT